MKFRASGRLALIAVAALYLCGGTPPSTAAAATAEKSAADGKPVASKTHAAAKSGRKVEGKHVARKYARHRTRGALRHASSRAHKVALRHGVRSMHLSRAVAPDDDHAAALPASVANANAEMQTPAATLMADASDSLPAPSQADSSRSTPQIAASDQFNEIDRASAQAAPPRTVAQATVSAPDDSLWDQTSLIGKIFVAFGGLLTMASAARMFMS